MHILDISWNRKNNTEEFIQELTVFDTEIKKIPLENYRWAFELSEERFCPGYFDEHGQYIPCSTNSKLTKKSYDKCFYCSGKDGWKAAFLFGDTPNAKMQKYLDKDHQLYLAFFLPNKIKVGTSSRSTERLLEQDALIYGFIGKEEGHKVQIIEKAISKGFADISETVQSRSKLKFINQKPDIKKSAEILKDAFSRIKSKFEDADFKNKLYDSIDIKNFLDRSDLYFPEKIPEVKKDPITLVGNHLGIRGKYVILEKAKNEYSFNTRDIIGKKIIKTLNT